MIRTKREQRKLSLKERDLLSEADRKLKSRIILKKILRTKAYREADTILTFVSYGSEVDTKEFIRQALEDDKKVYAPKVEAEGDNNPDEMSFYRIFDLRDLKEGYKGIPEPEANLKNRFDGDPQNKKTLMLMPGVCFDRSGNRIGYGKGFYDRYLAKGFQGIKLAICFDIQLVESGCFESEETDQKPDLILTETEHLDIDLKTQALTFERLSREVVYKAHRVLVYEDTYRKPDGEIVKYDYVENRNGAGILLVDEEGKLLFVKQYRITLDRVDIEIPAGCLDHKEEGYETAALREAEEETGFIPGKIHFVTKMIAAVGLFSEQTAIFIGTDLSKGSIHRDEDEFLEVVRYSLEEALDMIYDGTIVDSKTIIAIFAYRDLFLSHKM